ncbi:DUF3592 domain-containing protein [Streptomyces sp. NPDC057694]|uniref:DUF3592 domain-containing protein n=1 Tax=Streptomyces sp. NPDC057694 TaxID=3346216 RepID=UPI0036CBF6D7
MTTLWLLALLPFLTGIALTAGSVVRLAKETLRRTTGTVAEATVTGHTASREATYATLHPVVSWTADDGTAREVALPDASGAHALPEGARVRVRFDPSRPELAALETDTWYRSCVRGMYLGTFLWAGTLIVVVCRLAYVVNDLRPHYWGALSHY